MSFMFAVQEWFADTSAATVFLQELHKITLTISSFNLSGI